MRQYRTFIRKILPDYNGEWEELENYKYTVAESEQKALKEDIDFIVENLGGTAFSNEYGCMFVTFYDPELESEATIEVRTEPVEDGYALLHIEWNPESGIGASETIDNFTDFHPGDAEAFGKDWIGDAVSAAQEIGFSVKTYDYDGDFFEIADYSGRIVDQWRFKEH